MNALVLFAALVVGAAEPTAGCDCQTCRTLRTESRTIRATFDKDMVLEMSGDVDTLLEFDLLMRNTMSPSWSEYAHQIERRAKAVEAIRERGKLRIDVSPGNPIQRTVVRGLQSTIDKWDGEFAISNPLPTSKTKAAVATAKCKHDGPHFIAENSQGTFCIDCGAKIKD